LPKLRRLSGAEVVAVFESFGFAVVSTRGSHVKLQRMTATGVRQTLHVPLHRELDTGTCHGLYKQASVYLGEVQLRPHFYSE
jgi:predicted RNA binding protein YcfA (HicA-like mRNA interferase family)